jgi:hypothetical protein
MVFGVGRVNSKDIRVLACYFSGWLHGCEIGWVGVEVACDAMGLGGMGRAWDGYVG